VIDGRPADVYEAIRYASAECERHPHRLLSVLAAIGGTRLGRAGAVYGAALAFYLLAIRPLLLRWGASDNEVRREAPGDQAVAKPHTISTRAVTIHAQPDHIWPWLAQMGDGRGGLYSYDWLDRRFGYISSPSSDEILPQFQNLAVGDVIPLGKGSSWPVIIAEPDRALVVEPVAGQVSWAWAPERGRHR
jgi:hypothetical protein